MLESTQKSIMFMAKISLNICLLYLNKAQCTFDIITQEQEQMVSPQRYESFDM